MAVYFAAAAAGRHDPLARALPRRPPHARAQGQLLGPALHDRPLRRLARDEPRRLRRGPRARQGAPAEADRLRRLGVSAHGRDLARSARSPTRSARSFCATWRTSRGSSRPGCTRTPSSTATSSPRRRTRRSPARAPGSSSAARSTRRRSTAPSSRGCRAGRSKHVIAAKATCFQIAASEPFREYQRQVRANADALAETLMAGGLDVLTGGTDTHLLLSSTCAAPSGRARTPRSGSHEVGLTTNRNTVPFDERPPTVASGVRIGTPAATMRGFDEEDFREVGADHRRRARRRRRRRRARGPQRGALREAAALPGLPGFTTFGD